jgi:hypothetical protein
VDTNEALRDLPRIKSGQTDVIHIKGEDQSINYGLRSDSADVFNNRIQGIRGLG